MGLYANMHSGSHFDGMHLDSQISTSAPGVKEIQVKLSPSQKQLQTMNLKENESLMASHERAEYDAL